MRFFLAAGATIFTVSAMAQQLRGFVTLQQLQHAYRPVLIFAAKPDDPQLEIQIRTLQQHAAEASDRQIVAVAVVSDGPPPTAAHLTPADAAAARRHFHANSGEFTAVLLGKDGGEKLRANKPLSMEQLNSTIDAMPMRQQEMHRKRGQ